MSVILMVDRAALPRRYAAEAAAAKRGWAGRDWFDERGLVGGATVEQSPVRRRCLGIHV